MHPLGDRFLLKNKINGCGTNIELGGEFFPSSFLSIIVNEFSQRLIRVGNWNRKAQNMFKHNFSPEEAYIR